MGIHFEILEEQMTPHDPNGVVIEAHFHTIGFAHKISRV